MAHPDLSEFHKLSRPKKPPCKVGLAAARLQTDDDRAALAAACSTDANIITGSAITRWLEKRIDDANLSLSPAAVTSHRHQSCTCFDG